MGSEDARWRHQFNIAGLPEGSFRSIAGYAAESLVIGRAMQCGYNLFFKAWRDSPYDGVLDHNGVLFRIEIKGTTTDSLSVTAGGRAGAQIDRDAEDRTHLIDIDAVDLVLGVNNLNADCYLIPTEVIKIFGQQSLTLKKLAVFREQWGLIRGVDGTGLTSDDIRGGFLRRNHQDRAAIFNRLGLGTMPHEQATQTLLWEGVRGGALQNLPTPEWSTLRIWQSLLTA